MARHESLTPLEREDITNEVDSFLRSRDMSANKLAKEAGVVQPFVWSVLNGQFRKSTPRLRRLLQYIHMKNETADPTVQGLSAAISRFMAAGGDLGLLRSSVDMLAAAFEAEQRRPAGRNEKRAAA